MSMSSMGRTVVMTAVLWGVFAALAGGARASVLAEDAGYTCGTPAEVVAKCGEHAFGTPCELSVYRCPVGDTASFLADFDPACVWGAYEAVLAAREADGESSAETDGAAANTGGEDFFWAAYIACGGEPE